MPHQKQTEQQNSKSWGPNEHKHFTNDLQLVSYPTHYVYFENINKTHCIMVTWEQHFC